MSGVAAIKRIVVDSVLGEASQKPGQVLAVEGRGELLDEIAPAHGVSFRLGPTPPRAVRSAMAAEE